MKKIEEIFHKLIVSYMLITILSAVGVYAQPATGPLKIHPTNTNYFMDGATGKAVYLTGSHTWDNLQDMGDTDPPPKFDYDAYLNWLSGYAHNFIRLWVFEQTKGNPNSRDTWIWPHPYKRTGPGESFDGKLKFDLNQFDPKYFERLRSRVIKARDKAFYVSIMLFQGWSIDTSFGNKSNPWENHPFNKNNNINGIDGDFYNQNGTGEEYHSIMDPRILNYQKAYIRKVIDAVNDLDNVLYEIANEDPSMDSYWTEKHKEWQYELVDYIKSYEITKSKQHPVGITTHSRLGNDFVFNSKADWVSPARTAENRCAIDLYKDDPPKSGAKIILLDTDHIWGIGGKRNWVWKSFMRGYNPIYMDPLNDRYTKTCDGIKTTIDLVDVRKNMGYTLEYAKRLNLASILPRNDLTSTKYCLANPGSEYLIYQPNSGPFTVNLEAGEYDYEWFMPDKGSVQKTGSITTGGEKMSFSPPFKGDAVLYLHLHHNLRPS